MICVSAVVRWNAVTRKYIQQSDHNVRQMDRDDDMQAGRQRDMKPEIRRQRDRQTERCIIIGLEEQAL